MVRFAISTCATICLAAPTQKEIVKRTGHRNLLSRLLGLGDGNSCITTFVKIR